MKKIIQCLSLIVICLALAWIAPTEANAATVASGECGDNLTWVLTDDGTLTISGEGEMWDWSSATSVPWYYERFSISTIIINRGVTSIGDRALYNCTSLASITIPDGVTSIGDTAFYNCDSLASVTIPDSVTSIDDYAFSGCSSLAYVDFIGTENQWNAISIGDYIEPLLNATIAFNAITVPVLNMPGKTVSGKIILSWSAVTNAEKYHIWRMIDNGTFVLVGETEGTEYYDIRYTPGTIWFYIVCPIVDGTMGESSNIVMIYQPVRVSGPPPRP